MIGMRILICNDDGIHAPGIRALYEAVKDLGEVFVVAPHTEQSAVGHAITLANPIKCQKIFNGADFFGYAVGGTPADCVKLAVYSLLADKRPDLIISGINFGPNTGISVIYSGTVSAATEGTILGIPSMAVSLATFKDPIWATAAHVARQFAIKLMKEGLPPETLLNVNVPNVPLNQIKGSQLTRMGRSRFVETFDQRTDPRGNIYYWMDGQLEMLGDARGTDVYAVENGYVSYSPIWFDLTHQAVMGEFEKKWSMSL